MGDADAPEAPEGEEPLTPAYATAMPAISMSVEDTKMEGIWNPEEGHYVLNTMDDLVDFANRVNGKAGYTANNFAGVTVYLGSNIDLGSISNWDPIGNGARSGKGPSGNTFKGIFDGQGFTVSNVYVSGKSGDQAAGFFGVLNGDVPGGSNYTDQGEVIEPNSGIVRNLVLSNIVIDCPGDELAGAAVGFVCNGALVEGVTIQSGSVKGLKGVGGVVGRMAVCGSIRNYTNNAAVTATGTNGSNVGGIVGAAYYTTPCNVMEIAGCTNNGAVTGDNGVGGIVGLSAAIISDCTNNGAVLDRAGGGNSSVGGIAGEQQTFGSITGCVNNADIRNDITPGDDTERKNAYGTGGIVGWVRYNQANYGTGSYALDGLIEVSGNTNNGRIFGGNDAGGIIGTLYNTAVVNDNVNHAAYLEARDFGGGIVGNYQYTVDTQIKVTFGESAEDLRRVTMQNNASSTPLDAMDVAFGNKGVFIYLNPVMKADQPNIEDNPLHYMTHHYAPAACTEAGVREYYSCDWCHNVYEDEAGEKQIVVEADEVDEYFATPELGHIHSDWVQDGDAGHHWYCIRTYEDGTCDLPGYICDFCEEIEEHHYGEWHVVRDATVGQSGIREHICNECGWTQTEEFTIEAPGPGGPAGETPDVPGPGPTDADPTPVPTPEPVADPVPAVPLAAAPVPAPAPAPAVAIPDEATPLAAAQAVADPEEEAIEEDIVPMSAFDDPDCWVHKYIILGMIASAVYGAGAMFRRRRYAGKIEKLDREFLDGTAEEAQPVRGKSPMGA